MICTQLSPLLLSFSFTAMTCICGTRLVCLVCVDIGMGVRIVFVNCDEMTLEGVEQIRMASIHQINIFIFHRMANF